MSDFALQRRFPTRGEPVIDPEIGSEQSAIGSVAKVLDRTEFDFHLARFRHRCIRSVEGTIGPRSAGPAGKHGRRSERATPPTPFMGPAGTPKWPPVRLTSSAPPETDGQARE